MANERTVLPAVVAGLTILATGVSARIEGLGGLGTLLAIAIPWIVPTMWGALALTATRPATIAAAASGWVAAGMLLFAGSVMMVCAAYVATGILLGWGLRKSWRPDVLLGAAVVPLAAITAWTVVQLPLTELLADLGQQMTEAVRQGLPGAKDQAVLLAEYERGIAATVGALNWLWPGMMCVLFLVQISLILLLVRGLGRRLRPDLPIAALPAFSGWRVPFYLVWVLAVGVGLILTRATRPVAIGVNLVLVAGALFAVQGLAVQVYILGRLLPPWLRILFWSVAAFLFVPLIAVSSALLGLVDQWLDLRRLAATDGRGPRL